MRPSFSSLPNSIWQEFQGLFFSSIPAELPEPVWVPDLALAKLRPLYKFAEKIAQAHKLDFFRSDESLDYTRLQHWSCENPEIFWPAVAKETGFIFQEPATAVLNNPTDLINAKWFPGAKVNYAQNLLKYFDKPWTAITATDERGQFRHFSYPELYKATAEFASSLDALGVTKGDRVAALVPNTPEATISLLGTTAKGGIWTGCSPEFGVKAIVDRFAAVQPKILVATDAYMYGGKVHPVLPKVREVASQLPSVEQIIVVPFEDKVAPLEKEILWDQFVDKKAEEVTFEPVGFEDPALILYTSGTSGPPKKIQHGAGTTSLQHSKELALHVGITPQEKFFYYSNTSWMMYNWNMGGLAHGAEIIQYDGAPEPNHLFKLAEDLGINVFGTSAPFLIDVKRRVEANELKVPKLPKLRTTLSTAAILPPNVHEWFIKETGKPVLTMSGGTDIDGCFMIGCPSLPIYPGQMRVGLGMSIKVLDPDTKSAVRGKLGDLVVTKPAPTLPKFWNDPDGEQVRKSYYQDYPGIYSHSDIAVIHDNDKVVIRGRAGDKMNINGILTAPQEVYEVLTDAVPEVVDQVLVPQDQADGTQKALLFLQLAENTALCPTMETTIRRAIRTQLSPRHVPKVIAAVSEIPKTQNGKRSDAAVRDCVQGLEPANMNALKNPEVIPEFLAFAETQTAKFEFTVK